MSVGVASKPIHKPRGEITEIPIDTHHAGLHGGAANRAKREFGFRWRRATSARAVREMPFGDENQAALRAAFLGDRESGFGRVWIVWRLCETAKKKPKEKMAL